MSEPIKQMTTREFAEVTGISTATIAKLIRDGKIKAKKEGKAWMIPSSQLDSVAIREIRNAPQSAKQRKPSQACTKKKAAEAPTPEAAEPKRPQPAVVSSAPPELQTAHENTPQPAGKPAAPEKSYSVPEFAAMTYLTENGVSEWLKSGRLQGCKIENGEWRVLESNLNAPDISRLVRK